MSDNRSKISGVNSPPVERLSWDAWNLEHIAKHDVLPEEAEEVVDGDPYIRATYKQRLQLIGPTTAGRMLSIVIGAVPGQPGVFYVFSARPASRNERGWHVDAKGGMT